MSSLDGLCLKSIGYLLPTEKEIGKKERCTSLMKDFSTGMVRCRRFIIHSCLAYKTESCLCPNIVLYSVVFYSESVCRNTILFNCIICITIQCSMEKAGIIVFIICALSHALGLHNLVQNLMIHAIPALLENFRKSIMCASSDLKMS